MKEVKECLELQELFRDSQSRLRNYYKGIRNYVLFKKEVKAKLEEAVSRWSRINITISLWEGQQRLRSRLLWRTDGGHDHSNHWSTQINCLKVWSRHRRGEGA